MLAREPFEINVICYKLFKTRVTWTKARQLKPNLVIASLLSKAGVWSKLITQVNQGNYNTSNHFMDSDIIWLINVAFSINYVIYLQSDLY